MRHIVKYKINDVEYKGLVSTNKQNGHNLPSEYDELECITSSGTQYIATGVSTSSKQIIAQTTMKCKYDANYTKTLGYSSSTAGPPFSLWAFGNNYSGYGTSSITTTDITKYKDITMYATASIPNFYIFDVNPSVGGYNRTSGSIKVISIKVAGTLVRNLIPAKRKSDNVVGMYDLCGSICPLTNTPFYINAGTGNLIAGESILNATKLHVIKTREAD